MRSVQKNQTDCLWSWLQARSNASWWKSLMGYFESLSDCSTAQDCVSWTHVDCVLRRVAGRNILAWRASLEIAHSGQPHCEKPRKQYQRDAQASDRIARLFTSCEFWSCTLLGLISVFPMKSLPTRRASAQASGRVGTIAASLRVALVLFSWFLAMRLPWVSNF